MAEEEQAVPQEPEDSGSPEPESGVANEPQAESQTTKQEPTDSAEPEPESESESDSDGTSNFDLPPLSLGGSSELPDGIALLKDVNLDVKIELGRTRMVVDDVLRLSEGAVVELDKLAGDPVDIYVNGRHIARGEVLVLNENFCVRISEILAGAEAAAKQIASAAADAMSA